MRDASPWTGPASALDYLGLLFVLTHIRPSRAPSRTPALPAGAACTPSSAGLEGSSGLCASWCLCRSAPRRVPRPSSCWRQATLGAPSNPPPQREVIHGEGVQGGAQTKPFWLVPAWRASRVRHRGAAPRGWQHHEGQEAVAPWRGVRRARGWGEGVLAWRLSAVNLKYYIEER